MRSVTEGEAAAVRSLLAGRPVSERERARQSGLETRTFERIRRRAYELEWVFDRYLPHPVRTGLGTAHFVVARPFTDRIEAVQKRWESIPSTVLLWRWPETLLGVFFSSESRDRFLARLGDLGERPETFVVSSPTDAAHVPVYFDFEAAWSRLTGQKGTLAYPHPLTSDRGGSQSDGRGEIQDTVGLANLLSRPWRSGGGKAPLHVSPFFLPKSQQRLLVTGAVQRRTFLDPQKMLPFQGRSFERVAFVQGELLATDSEQELFRVLMALKVTPFLFASDGARVLLATFSQSPADLKGPGARPNVLATLQTRLRDVRIVRESIQSLSVRVNHRYDRLFGSA